MTRAQKAEHDEALTRMHEWVKPGDTVWTILEHVSRSGMSRRVRVVVMIDGFPIHPNHAVAHAIGAKLGRGGMSDSIQVGGCGFDAGFEVVYNLGHAMFPDGFGCIGEGCPSNDHSNGDPQGYTPHSCKDIGYFPQQHDAFNTDGEKPHQTLLDDTFKGDHRFACHWHRDGGYALRARWL